MPVNKAYSVFPAHKKCHRFNLKSTILMTQLQWDSHWHQWFLVTYVLKTTTECHQDLTGTAEHEIICTECFCKTRTEYMEKDHLMT